MFYFGTISWLILCILGTNKKNGLYTLFDSERSDKAIIVLSKCVLFFFSKKKNFLLWAESLRFVFTQYSLKNAEITTGRLFKNRFDTAKSIAEKLK